MVKLPILKFNPILFSKPWGGNALWNSLNKGSSHDQSMGESWELSDRLDANSVVSADCGQTWSGRKFSDLMQEFKQDLMGENISTTFPLLYKFICAREKLSVQVHPGTGSNLGEAKTECWVVIDALPGAELIVGVSPHGLSENEMIEILKTSNCESVLRRWPAKRGDVFFIPAGTVHAITEGLLLYEVQQNSDTTFRLYDWGRVDLSGQPRALNVDKASQVADLKKREGYAIPSLEIKQPTHLESYLVACPYFALVKWSNIQLGAKLFTQGRFRVITTLSGSCRIMGENNLFVELNKGDTALIPSCIPSSEFTSVSEKIEVIISFVPDSLNELKLPLIEAGYSEQSISALFGPLHFQA